MSRKNILVFPCGSEIGLEIHRSLRYSTHVNIIGANSVNDHGVFVYENYIGDLPNVDHPTFITRLIHIVKQYAIHAIYPTMDKVIHKVKQHETELGCVVIASPAETTEICTSKRTTYALLVKDIPTPQIFHTIQEITSYPVFSKPDKGYGSRGAKKLSSAVQVASHLQEYPDSIVMEFLPGPEFTVDCFTNHKGELLFAGPRQRRRIMNGISVNTATMPGAPAIFRKMAEKINAAITFRGAWFFQVKENSKGTLTLLEIASRLAGTSSVHRAQGVNFALLSVFDAFQFDVEIFPNTFNAEVDRALDAKYRLDIRFDTAYIDLDDTLIVNDRLNLSLITLIYQFIADKKKIVLLTKHERDIAETLSRFRISGLFDEVIHIGRHEHKAEHIKDKHAIFIDDSFAERKAVMERLNIPVFAPDAIESLIQ